MMPAMVAPTEMPATAPHERPPESLFDDSIGGDVESSVGAEPAFGVVEVPPDVVVLVESVLALLTLK